MRSLAITFVRSLGSPLGDRKVEGRRIAADIEFPVAVSYNGSGVVIAASAQQCSVSECDGRG